MSARNHLRYLFVDVAIVFVMCVIGWVVVRLGKMETSMTSAERQLDELPGIFQECHQLFGEGIESPEAVRRGFDLILYDALLVKAEYLTIADRLQADLPDLKAAVSSRHASKRQPDLPGRMRDLKTWIEKQKERTGLERFARRSKEIKERMVGVPLSATNGPLAATNGALVIVDDLQTLLQKVEQGYDRYAAAFQEVSNNAGKPLVETFVAQQLDLARQAAARLGDLESQARRDGNAVELFLQRQAQSSKLTRRQQEIMQAFVEARSPAEFIERVRTTRPPGGSSSEPSPVKVPPTRQVRHALLAALGVLGVFLLTDVYLRGAVVPFRMKLAERNTIIEQQEKLAHFEQLAAGVAHEIRNPLTTISARLHTIQRKLSEETPERRDATVIGNEIERINTILKEFIQLTRPSAPNLVVMTAEPLLKDVSDLMGPQFQRQSVALECQSQGKTQFKGDPQQLKQVLINLLQNAIESVGRDGRVTLRARDGAMPLKGTQTKVAIIEVEDNGPGIRPEVQPRLFEAFFSTKKGGTGLGLPISARIIDRHGGALGFETEPGRGTVFRIVLPAHEKD